MIPSPKNEFQAPASIKALTAIFGECLNYKSGLRILIMPRRKRRRVRKMFGENRTHFGVFNNGDLDKKKLQLYVEAIIGESGGKQN